MAESQSTASLVAQVEKALTLAVNAVEALTLDTTNAVVDARYKAIAAESLRSFVYSIRPVLLAAEQERARDGAIIEAQANFIKAAEMERDAARAERDALQERAQQWRQIETAPKEPKHDAPRIIAYWRESGWTEIVFWSDYREAWCAGDGGWGSDRWRGENAPTHWMPLPAPPEATHE
jgi:hypothetical protein